MFKWPPLVQSSCIHHKMKLLNVVVCSLYFTERNAQEVLTILVAPSNTVSTIGAL